MQPYDITTRADYRNLNNGNVNYSTFTFALAIDSVSLPQNQHTTIKNQHLQHLWKQQQHAPVVNTHPNNGDTTEPLITTR